MPNVNPGPAVTTTVNYTALEVGLPATTSQGQTSYGNTGVVTTILVTLANLPTTVGVAGSGTLWNDGGVVAIS